MAYMYIHVHVIDTCTYIYMYMNEKGVQALPESVHFNEFSSFLSFSPISASNNCVSLCQMKFEGLAAH